MSDRFVPVPPARTGSDVIQPGNCRDVDNPIGTQKTYVILAQRPHWPVRLTGKLPKCVFGTCLLRCSSADRTTWWPSKQTLDPLRPLSARGTLAARWSCLCAHAFCIRTTPGMRSTISFILHLHSLLRPAPGACRESLKYRTVLMTMSSS